MLFKKKEVKHDNQLTLECVKNYPNGAIRLYKGYLNDERVAVAHIDTEDSQVYKIAPWGSFNWRNPYRNEDVALIQSLIGQ